MDIDLDFDHEYYVCEEITIPYTYYQNSEVMDIKNLHVEGKFYYDYHDILKGVFQITGVLLLNDAISLEKVEYPFSINYDDSLDENLKKEENKLDLFEFLWENIVLEVPLKFTQVTNLSEFHGNGWKLISEEEVSTSNNPFNDLLKNFDKKE